MRGTCRRSDQDLLDGPLENFTRSHVVDRLARSDPICTNSSFVVKRTSTVLAQDMLNKGDAGHDSLQGDAQVCQEPEDLGNT